jgi:hypothetical protein
MVDISKMSMQELIKYKEALVNDINRYDNLQKAYKVIG